MAWSILGGRCCDQKSGFILVSTPPSGRSVRVPLVPREVMIAIPLLYSFFFMNDSLVMFPYAEHSSPSQEAWKLIFFFMSGLFFVSRSPLRFPRSPARLVFLFPTRGTRRSSPLYWVFYENVEIVSLLPPHCRINFLPLKSLFLYVFSEISVVPLVVSHNHVLSGLFGVSPAPCDLHLPYIATTHLFSRGVSFFTLSQPFSFWPPCAEEFLTCFWSEPSPPIPPRIRCRPRLETC